MHRRLTRSIWIAAALAVAAPAVADPAPRDDDLVDVTSVIHDAILDLRYATPNNFTGATLYPVARCRLRRAVAADRVVALRFSRLGELFAFGRTSINLMSS